MQVKITAFPAYDRHHDGIVMQKGVVLTREL